MTTTIQLSEKGGETGQAILLVKVEAPDNISPDVVYNHFVQVASEAGLQSTLDTFDSLAEAVRNAKTGLGATPATPATPPAPAAQSWGNPPVPPMQPQMPAAAQASQPAQLQHGTPGGTPCIHGQRTYIDGVTKSGKNAGKLWRAWACPAPQGQQCDKEWIRD